MEKFYKTPHLYEPEIILLLLPIQFCIGDYGQAHECLVSYIKAYPSSPQAAMAKEMVEISSARNNSTIPAGKDWLTPPATGLLLSLCSLAPWFHPLISLIAFLLGSDSCGALLLCLASSIFFLLLK